MSQVSKKTYFLTFPLECKLFFKTFTSQNYKCKKKYLLSNKNAIKMLRGLFYIILCLAITFGDF